MLTQPASVTTSSSVPAGLDYRGGAFGELVIVYNPATNSNNVFLKLNGDATTAAVTGQQVVAPGQYAFFILTAEDNGSGINAIAATGTTVVTVIRQSFRAVSERLAVMGGIFGGAVAAQFWVAISGTQVQLSGAFVEARADTVRAKTTNGLFEVAQNGTGGVRINSNSNLSNSRNTMIGANNGNAITAEFDQGGNLSVATSGTNRTVTSSGGLEARNATPIFQENGNGTDTRHTINVSRHIHHGTADGDVDQVMGSFEFPVANGSVVVIGDLVEFVPATQNRIRASGVGSTAPTIGQAASAGTGNAGGTIRVVVDMYGYKATPFLADVAGVTEGFYAFPGATNANRLASQPTVENTFAKIRATAASGVAVPLQFMGSM